MFSVKNSYAHKLAARTFSGAVLILSCVLAGGAQADLFDAGTESTSACTSMDGEIQVHDTYLCDACVDAYDIFHRGLILGDEVSLEDGAGKLCHFLSKYTHMDCTAFLDSLVERGSYDLSATKPKAFCMEIDFCSCAKPAD